MRISQVLSEAKAKQPKAGDTTSHDYNPGWEMLNHLKKYAKLAGERLAGSYQLFVPRANSAALSQQQRRHKNLANPWAYDDEGNLKPNYDKWERGVREAAPILSPGRGDSPPGNNKPSRAFWTSTGGKTSDGWASAWSQWTYHNQPDWFNYRGYLYRVKPGALILTLNSDRDAEQIFHAFSDMGRVKEPDSDYLRSDRSAHMRTSFPWDQVSRHFDAVHHGGFRYGGDDFVYGWDVESTAWFDTSFLQLIGEVDVVPHRDDD